MEIQPIRFALFYENQFEKNCEWCIKEGRVKEERHIFELSSNVIILQNHITLLSTNQFGKDPQGNPVELVDRDIVEWKNQDENTGSDTIIGAIERDKDHFYIRQLTKGFYSYTKEHFLGAEMSEWELYMAITFKHILEFYDEMGSKFKWENLVRIGNKLTNPELMEASNG